MHIYNLRYTVLGVFIFVSLFSFFAVTTGDTLQDKNAAQNINTKEQATLLFTGDIMLGRVVESLMERNGSTYPFVGMLDTLASVDVTVGNFEGTIPKVHQKTKPYTFSFSIREEYLGSLKSVGFDVLSLANNHSLDFGSQGLLNTHDACVRYGVVCVGEPQSITEFSVHRDEIRGHKVGYIFLNAVFTTPDSEKLLESIELLQKETDFVIAYVHWGDEYELTHSSEQEKLAHTLVDAGVNLVIGHHPHVVQDVGLYKGNLIVYSLGNFVFDQYFSEEVMEGILLKVTLGAHTHEYEFIGVTSSETQSQPHRMDKENEDVLFSRVLEEITHDEGRISFYAFN